MSFLIFIVSLAALLVALKALRDGRPLPGQPTPAERIQSLEDRIRDLLYRVWTLEQTARGAPAAPPPEPMSSPELMPAPEPAPPLIEPAPVAAPVWVPVVPVAHDTMAPPVSPPIAPEPTPVVTPASASTPNLEQRIGARWTTWVGVVAILFA